MERRRRCLIHFYGSSSRINRSSLILRSSMPLITYFAIENLMEGRLYMRLRIMRISKATEINWKQMTPYLKWGFTAEKGNPTNNKRHMKRSLWIYDRAERLEFWVYTGNISTSVYFIEKPKPSSAISSIATIKTAGEPCCEASSFPRPEWRPPTLLSVTSKPSWASS